MKSIRCAFHKEQIIGNFCRNLECLLPMCSICVKIHSLEHIKEKTQGMFDNIHDLTQQIQHSLAYHLKELLGLSHSLKSVMENKQRNLEDFRGHLRQSKQKIIQGIIEFLNAAEKQALKVMQDEMHSIGEDFRQIDNMIDELTGSIKKQIDGMQNENKMKTIINYLSANMNSFYEQENDKVGRLMNQLGQRKVKRIKQLNLNNVQEILIALKEQFLRSSSRQSHEHPFKENNPQNRTQLQVLLYENKNKDLSNFSTEKKTETSSSIYSNFHR